MNSAPAPASLAGADPAASEVPWLLPCAVIGATAIMIAAFWDFSWHRSIGRDTFFSPPHCVLYGGALLSCLSAAYTVLKTTFAAGARAGSVTVWGLRGPLGAFVIGWGGFTMLAAGLLDDWWHDAFGLDILIQSVPHMAVFAGMLGVFGGGLLLAVKETNAVGPRARRSSSIVPYMAGVGLTLMLAAFMEHTFTYLMRGARFYCVVALTAPGVLGAVGRVSGIRYAASAAALAYTVFTLLAIGILPLFPAEPLLGPVLRPIDHFVPPPFPLLVLPAALALDFLRPRLAQRSAWQRSALEGSAFLTVFTALQWPFASFLQSPWANNRVFVGHEFTFFQAESSLPVRRMFFPTETTPAGFWWGMMLALGLAVVTTRLGIAAGEWARKLRR